MTRLPRPLTQKRAALAYERNELAKRLAIVDAEIAALDFALRTISPRWQPPTRTTRPHRRSMLPRGAIAEGCLFVLREHKSLTTTELAHQVATRQGLRFETTAAQQDFASAVAMAMRRHEKRALVEIAAPAQGTRPSSWRLRAGPFVTPALLKTA